ncbi:heavy-metal-associated domain-containing protein [Paratissierella segnis]|jgi:copper chaperone|uniref:Heavy-metal-associated domain-containing protein n=1 Tax=Paratissierella segnis TaxID=2763679 RepID=A0A926ERS2_9FIRM|nr:copper ion binding protein [Paratissierella segnis]MBC8587330.1 heavy-metal-associated domain-containing protein [Paratissierella segnis]
MKKIMLVDGMSCEHCVKAVKNALSEVNGVASVKVDLQTKKVEVEGENMANDALKNAVEDAGYEVLEIN